MPFDLRYVPFSCAKSYLAISDNEAGFRGETNDEGLYLRTIHRSSYTPFVAKLVPTLDGERAAYRCEATPAELAIRAGEGLIQACFADARTILFKGTGKGIGLTLDFLCEKAPYDFAREIPGGDRPCLLANCYKNNRKYLMRAQRGSVVLDQRWNECKADHCRIRFEAREDGFLFSLAEIPVDWDGKSRDFDYEASRDGTARGFFSFAEAMPSAPDEYRAEREAAAYVDWASIAGKEGLLTRDAMYMSKNWMCSVWSWDHCFNAMALSYGNPEMAWDQFMLMFDYQDESGLIPDSVNDGHITWNFCKPPIHGWALSKMMERMKLSQAQEREAYDRLSGWTDWWLRRRDPDGDGVCGYEHGNDSGWDNSTAFQALPPVESPELQAYLAIQMETLSVLAEKLGYGDMAARWKIKSDKTLNAMLSLCFRNEVPRVSRGGTREEVPCDSLLPYQSIILGKRLPEGIRESLVRVLRSDVFLTEHGYATESPKSGRYLPDGYWRGPIWAPSTMIIVDGLERCGQRELARSVAKKFCGMVRKSGFAENFDALSGEGLRDRAYTWTASVFLILAHEYLD